MGRELGERRPPDVERELEDGGGGGAALGVELEEGVGGGAPCDVSGSSSSLS